MSQATITYHDLPVNGEYSYWPPTSYVYYPNFFPASSLSREPLSNELPSLIEQLPEVSKFDETEVPFPKVKEETIERIYILKHLI